MVAKQDSQPGHSLLPIVRRSFLFRYGLSLALLMATLLLRNLLHVDLRTEFLVLPLAGIVIAAFIGGWGPGMVAAVIGTVWIDYYYGNPPYTFVIKSQKEGVQMAMFVLSSIGLTWLTSRLVRAQEQLLRNSTELDTIIRSIPDSMVVYDHNGSIVRMNRAARELFGPVRSLTEQAILLEMPEGKSVSPSKFPAFRSLKGESIFDVTLAFVNESGKKIWLLNSSAPIKKTARSSAQPRCFSI